jgi:hypothetical protein
MKEESKKQSGLYVIMVMTTRNFPSGYVPFVCMTALFLLQ